MTILRLLVFVSLLIATFCCRAENMLLLDDKTQAYLDLSPWTSYLDTDEDLDIEAVLNLPPQAWSSTEPEETFGINAQDYWVKFSLNDQTTEETQYIISLANPHIDHIYIYHYSQGKQLQQIKMGDSLPFNQRPILNHDFLYPFDTEAGSQNTFYLKITSLGSAHAPLSLWNAETYLQHNEQQSLNFGLQIGTLIAIGLFGLFISYNSRAAIYFYYSCYVLTIAFYFMAYNGFAFRLFWPHWPEMQTHILPILISLAMLFAFLFTNIALELKSFSHRLYILCHLGAIYSVLLLLAIPFSTYINLLKLNIFSALAASLILMAITVFLGIKGQKLARLFAVGRFSMLLGTLLSGLIFLNAINININAESPFMLGLGFEIIFIAIVLSTKYRQQQLENEAIQAKALEQAQRLQEIRQESLALKEKSTEKLSEMVQERTLELEIAMRELNEANEKLTEQATIDSLTGVTNRGAFDKRLTAEGRISRRQQTPLAVLMVDIDKFKMINDTYGHLVGDQTLRTLAVELKLNLKRPGDLASRFGGEEFAIILPDTDKQGAMLVAETIRKAVLKLPVSWDKNTFPLSVSIGVSSDVVQSEEHTLELLDQADKALYQAKNSGRNRTILFNKEPSASSQTLE